MRTTFKLMGTSLVAMSALLSAEGLTAQDNAAHSHIGHVLDGFPATPNGEGLLTTALEETETAIQHAGLAAGNPEDLNAMQTHAAHVLHAVDPSRVDGGPGAGFGVKAAAEGIAQHIQLAASSDEASSNVATHSDHVAAAARTVAQRAEAIADLAEQIQSATAAGEAARLVQELHALTEELVPGSDATGDGQISWEEGEGGLAHVEQHMGFMAAGEGLD